VRELAVSVEAGALPGPPGSAAGVRTMLLRRAQHPETARAFVSYLDEQAASQAAAASAR
jgi:ABC-type Fe3+ transport system substrate-binding protein